MLRSAVDHVNAAPEMELADVRDVDRPVAASARTRASSGRRCSSSSAATKLVDPTRSASPSASRRWVNAKSRSLSSRPAKASRQAPLAWAGASPRYGAIDLADRGVQGRGLDRPAVPHERERAAGAQHALDLGQRHRPVEPMEGLADGHDVGAVIGERHGLGRAVEGAGRRTDGGAHLGHGLDRDHLAAQRGQRAGELAAARGEIDHRAPGAQIELLRQPRDRLGRVLRARTLVGLHRAREARRRRRDGPSEQTHLTVVDRHGDGLERGNLIRSASSGSRQARAAPPAPGCGGGAIASSSGSRAKSARSTSTLEGV